VAPVLGTIGSILTGRSGACARCGAACRPLSAGVIVGWASHLAWAAIRSCFAQLRARIGAAADNCAEGDARPGVGCSSSPRCRSASAGPSSVLRFSLLLLRLQDLTWGGRATSVGRLRGARDAGGSSSRASRERFFRPTALLGDDGGLLVASRCSFGQPAALDFVYYTEYARSSASLFIERDRRNREHLRVLVW